MDHEPFLRAIAALPREKGPLLVYADALDEAGDPYGAAALRWAAKYGHRPYRFSEAWAWLMRSYTTCGLPLWIGLRLEGSGSGRHYKHYNCAQAAWEDLMAAFRRAAADGAWPRPLRRKVVKS